jgi:hypothetical protein
MYADLMNIGHGNIKVAMTNAGTKIIKDIGEGKTETVFQNKTGEQYFYRVQKELAIGFQECIYPSTRESSGRSVQNNHAFFRAPIFYSENRRKEEVFVG